MSVLYDRCLFSRQQYLDPHLCLIVASVDKGSTVYPLPVVPLLSAVDLSHHAHPKDWRKKIFLIKKLNFTLITWCSASLHSLDITNSLFNATTLTEVTLKEQSGFYMT